MPTTYEKLEKESDKLRRENMMLKSALQECITNDGANCLAYGADTPTLRRRLACISNTAREAIAKITTQSTTGVHT